MALAGTEIVLQAAELPCNSAVPEDGWRQALQLLDGPQRPTAIFAASDTLALGVLKAARERNLHVPHDLAIIGFDDLDFAAYAGLTTVSQSLEESGRLAVELLLLHLEAPDRIAHHVQLPLKIVRRETA